MAKPTIEATYPRFQMIKNWMTPTVEAAARQSIRIVPVDIHRPCHERASPSRCGVC
jgi:hypothetical protein